MERPLTVTDNTLRGRARSTYVYVTEAMPELRICPARDTKSGQD